MSTNDSIYTNFDERIWADIDVSDLRENQTFAGLSIPTFLESFSLPVNLPPSSMISNSEIFPLVDMAETGADRVAESGFIDGSAGKIIDILPSMELSREACYLKHNSGLTNSKLAVPNVA
ncbi:hypothetical protein EYZ11_006221 [Aspergillus tanneri]|uniref:Uncharacterized protein n=1 Tax=Aspergillus tanneri TaxID=1220188 RepID=A0A4S3JGJ0_9EURO|nr:hypothetical protein EYZ11_006221 [Aspergillus tanneri]